MFQSPAVSPVRTDQSVDGSEVSDAAPVIDEHRVFISGVPASSTTADVREHFGSFGTIANCCKIDKHPTKNFTGNRINARPAVAFVSFTSDEAVQAVLAEYEHLILGERVNVARAVTSSALREMGGSGPDAARKAERDAVRKVGSLGKGGGEPFAGYRGDTGVRNWVVGRTPGTSSTRPQTQFEKTCVMTSAYEFRVACDYCVTFKIEVAEDTGKFQCNKPNPDGSCPGRYASQNFHKDKLWRPAVVVRSRAKGSKWQRTRPRPFNWSGKLCVDESGGSWAMGKNSMSRIKLRPTFGCGSGNACRYAHGSFEKRVWETMCPARSERLCPFGHLCPMNHDGGVPAGSIAKHRACRMCGTTEFDSTGTCLGCATSAMPFPTSTDLCADPRYKTLLCSHFMQNGECPFGASCIYAHGEHEKRDLPASSSGAVHNSPGGTPMSSAPTSSWVTGAPITAGTSWSNMAKSSISSGSTAAVSASNSAGSHNSHMLPPPAATAEDFPTLGKPVKSIPESARPISRPAPAVADQEQASFEDELLSPSETSDAEPDVVHYHAVHTDWTDTVVLRQSGKFERMQKNDGGIWATRSLQDGQLELTLKWTKWPREVLVSPDATGRLFNAVGNYHFSLQLMASTEVSGRKPPQYCDVSTVAVSDAVSAPAPAASMLPAPTHSPAPQGVGSKTENLDRHGFGDMVSEDSSRVGPAAPQASLQTCRDSEQQQQGSSAKAKAMTRFLDRAGPGLADRYMLKLQSEDFLDVELFAECEASDYAELGISADDTALIRTALATPLHSSADTHDPGQVDEEAAVDAAEADEERSYQFSPDPAVFELLVEAKVQGAEHYYTLLSNSEVDYEALELMNAADMIEVGITALGARKKILHALAARQNA
eukprot:SAG31_NODE_961_length_10749_cov_7.202160_6_plen_883_part_00